MGWWKLETAKAIERAAELLAAAEDTKDPAMLLVGNAARGTTLFQIGELGSATQHLEKALAVFDLRQPLPWQLELSRVTSFCYLDLGLFRIGYPDRTCAKSRQIV